jgi:hypothetical protein
MPEKETIESASKKLTSAFVQLFESPDPKKHNAIKELIIKFHKLDAPEKDKLLAKDKILVNFIAILEKAIADFADSHHITETEEFIFKVFILIFGKIESILWELKRLHFKNLPKNPPKPRPHKKVSTQKSKRE